MPKKRTSDMSQSRGIIASEIKNMMMDADVSYADAAEVLGKDIQSFRNKLSKNVFSIQELCIIAAMCKKDLALVGHSSGNGYFILKPEEVCNHDMVERYKQYKQRKHQEQYHLLSTLSEDVLYDYLGKHPELIKEYRKILKEKNEAPE